MNKLFHRFQIVLKLKIHFTRVRKRVMWLNEQRRMYNYKINKVDAKYGNCSIIYSGFMFGNGSINSLNFASGFTDFFKFITSD